MLDCLHTYSNMLIMHVRVRAQRVKTGVFGLGCRIIFALCKVHVFVCVLVEPVDAGGVLDDWLH